MSLPTYVVQASPLSKLFMREWHARIEEEPDLVFADVPFTVTVPRTSGALVFEHNKPVHINNILPKQPSRKKDEYLVDDVEVVINWLTGGVTGDRSEETDIYGVVGLDLDMDISAALADIVTIADNDGESSKKAIKNFDDMQKALKAKAKTAHIEAQKLADSRVRRAIEITHINLKKSFEAMNTQGLRPYTPSVAEAVGAHILAKAIDESGKRRREMLERMNKVLQQTVVTN